MATTKRVTIRQSDLKPEADKAKKIYRFAVEVVRRLDDVLKQPKAQKDVFLPEAIQLRSKLQEHCEKLMFYDPLEYGRKAEEMLWRKVYYDVIQLMKHNKRQMRPNKMLNSAFKTHLSAALGYYHHLLFRLQHEFALHLDGIMDFCYLPDHKSHQRQNQQKKPEPDAEVKEWAVGACHRCLVYLGDIARYQNEYESLESCMLAQRYYHQAVALMPDIGMPHNQLGTLAGGRLYNLGAIYHYIRCLCCPASFSGAHNNIKRLFDKNKKRYQELSQTSPRDLPPDQQRTKDIKKFIVRFISLLDAFLYKEKSDDSVPIQELCQSTLQDLNLCMFYQPPHVTNPSLAQNNTLSTSDDKLTYLDDEALFKIVIICVGTVHLLQLHNSRQLAAAIAFSLALFSHIINHAVIRLQSALYELESPRKILEVESGDEKKEDSDTEDEMKDSDLKRQKRRMSENGMECRDKDGETEKSPIGVSLNQQKGDKKQSKFRRQRRRRRENDGNDSDSGSDLSEGNGGDGLMVSDEDDAPLDFLNNSQSSNSDSEDPLVISQELKPGFMDLSLRNSLIAEPELQSVQEDVGDGGLPESSMSFLDGTSNSTTSQGSSPRYSSTSGLLTNVNNHSTSRFEMPVITADVSDYLRDFPTEWLADSSQLLSQTLQWAGLLTGTQGLSQQDDTFNDPNINAVVQGKKEVRAPPGFETSLESRHVMEISEKLANFNIETDTDTGNISTDIENSTITTESEFDTETEGETDSVIEKGDENLQRRVQVMTNEGLLLAIKVYCDWLKCNPHIITTCAKSSQSLWTRLSVLLNFLPQLPELDRIDFCRTPDFHQMVKGALASEWQQVHPLLEDFHLHKFPPLSEVQKLLIYDSNRRMELAQQQEAILRLCCLRHFGYFVAKLKGVNFTYHASTGQFVGPQQSTQSINTSSVSHSVVTDEARRNQLMRDMAQLRLQAEVNQLEGSLQSKGHVSLPPYIVTDAPSLCEHLSLIKQLVSSARFILIVPVVVIDHLDMMKKENANAREVIRWLEAELKKGNRYLRAQKNHEKASTDGQKMLKKRDLTAWRLSQIVDCARYLCRQTPDCDSRGMVSVLSVSSNATTGSAPLKQVLSYAHQQGIVVQDAIKFYSKWKDTCKPKKT